jgi:hypothetical protein
VRHTIATCHGPRAPDHRTYALRPPAALAYIWRSTRPSGNEKGYPNPTQSRRNPSREGNPSCRHRAPRHRFQDRTNGSRARAHRSYYSVTRNGGQASRPRMRECGRRGGHGLWFPGARSRASMDSGRTWTGHVAGRWPRRIADLDSDVDMRCVRGVSTASICLCVTASAIS